MKPEAEYRTLVRADSGPALTTSRTNVANWVSITIDGEGPAYNLVCTRNPSKNTVTWTLYRNAMRLETVWTRTESQ